MACRKHEIRRYLNRAWLNNPGLRAHRPSVPSSYPSRWHTRSPVHLGLRQSIKRYEPFLILGLSLSSLSPTKFSSDIGIALYTHLCLDKLRLKQKAVPYDSLLYNKRSSRTSAKWPILLQLEEIIWL